MKNTAERVNKGFRASESFYPLPVFAGVVLLTLAGVFLVETSLLWGVALMVVGAFTLTFLLVKSFIRADVAQKAYLEKLSQDELMSLIGKDMAYQSKFSTAQVLQVLDRRFPGWRTTEHQPSF